MKITVLMGGKSSERDISIRSGTAVVGALRKKGHDVSALDPKESDFIERLLSLKPDAVFIALHGRYGEDGCIQGLLECLELPYTGSSVQASALCFDKQITKDVLQGHGIPLAEHQVYEKTSDLTVWLAHYSMAYPVIVKPTREGSTIGMTRVQNREQLQPAMAQALGFGSTVLVEKYIEGREVTVSILNGEALPIVEVVPKGGFYDFKAKYTKGQTQYIVPAPLDATLSDTLQKLSVRIYNILKCSGAARADYMLDRDLQPYFLEVNTIPGMTETSLLPMAAGQQGYSFEDLCEAIVQKAATINHDVF